MMTLFLNTQCRLHAAKIPVIDVTDLYHPCQDVGDNFDLITPYALPEIDLKAVILDCTDEFRKTGIDPGFVPVLQLNYIFNREIPCGTIPWRRMTSLDDKMLDAPGFQQQGIELMLRILRESAEPVHVLSFGSARAIAVAYNRDPALCLKKIKLIYLCAGASNYDKEVEHNVRLDRLAIVRLLRSKLPVALFPCGADNSNGRRGRNPTCGLQLLPQQLLLENAQFGFHSADGQTIEPIPGLRLWPGRPARYFVRDGRAQNPQLHQ